MNYSKLLLPAAFMILLTTIVALFDWPDLHAQLTLGIFLKAGLLIYYLRVNNSGTPFINTLTSIMILVMAGEYLINTGFVTTGNIIYVVANIGFAVMYFLRHVMKDKRDKLMTIKVLATCCYCLANILHINDDTELTVLLIGHLVLGGVYFYDRLLAISESKRFQS
jgi:hypothetical protein